MSDELKSINPFDFVNAINLTKKDLIAEDPQCEKEYTKGKFLVNRALGYFHDTVLPANVMNMYHDIPSKWQFHFFLNIIRPAKRFAKWVKKQEDDDIARHADRVLALPAREIWLQRRPNRALYIQPRALSR